jgi:hypothetical protein
VSALGLARGHGPGAVRDVIWSEASLVDSDSPDMAWPFYVRATRVHVYHLFEPKSRTTLIRVPHQVACAMSQGTQHLHSDRWGIRLKGLTELRAPSVHFNIQYTHDIYY